MTLRVIGARSLLTGALLIGAAVAGPVAVPLMAQGEPPEVIYLFADLSGSNEIAGGDKDGFGDLAAALKLDEGKFCFELSVGDIAAPTAAHIHEGKAGVDGAPVITITVTGARNETCIDTDKKLLRKIADKPGDFYVNVHNEKFPAGAIRGQLQA